MAAEIYSIEKLAEATEEAMQEMGMGARDLKKKAEAYLSAHNKDAETMRAQDKKIAEQAEQMSDLQKKFDELTAAQK